VGWERELFTATTFIADADLPPATHPINKAHAIVAMSLLDCFSVVLYFAVTLLIIWKARKLARDADIHTVSVHQSAMLCSRLVC
jgi:predicted membrane protein